MEQEANLQKKEGLSEFSILNKINFSLLAAILFFLTIYIFWVLHPTNTPINGAQSRAERIKEINNYRLISLVLVAPITSAIGLLAGLVAFLKREKDKRLYLIFGLLNLIIAVVIQLERIKYPPLN